jgi:hypothetical protein
MRCEGKIVLVPKVSLFSPPVSRQCPTEIVETCTRLHDVSLRCGKVDKSLMGIHVSRDSV